jgi:hypothetical protein
MMLNTKHSSIGVELCPVFFARLFIQIKEHNYIKSVIYKLLKREFVFCFPGSPPRLELKADIDRDYSR